MNPKKNLKTLLSRIEGCLKCYDEFKDYDEDDRLRIRSWHNEDPWFFPPNEEIGVMGFFGTGKTFIVCERPSTRGNIPSPADLSFYELLRNYGFENAHITDLVKCRGYAGGLFDEELENCLPYLEKEIEILKPNLIIAVGNSAYDVMTEHLRLGSIHLEKVTHYSYAFRYNKAERIEEELRNISQSR